MSHLNFITIYVDPPGLLLINLFYTIVFDIVYIVIKDTDSQTSSSMYRGSNCVKTEISGI